MERGQLVGPFVIEKELGAGAMGAVYRAKHGESGVRVAIKVMAPGLMANKTSLDRFQREANILKQLKHPNIVRLLATGKFQGSPFYAMEYVQGESLDHVMARRGRITWEEVVTLGRQLCDALQHVHDRGIVHRDLKPSNVMVLADDTVKLTDFGIAKDLDVTALTAANCTVGTAAYMSPEQCRGDRDISHKSDLYSLGVMFYELLTGRKPFYAESAMEMFMQHANGTFERPSRTVLDVPMWLDTLVVQLLEKKPEDRPLSAAEVGEALTRIKEKVEAQQSAGVELARGRGIDHPKRQAQLDDEDREAARTLAGKKKRRKKVVPLHHQRWVQGVGLLVALLVVAAVIYAAFRPTSPEKLYAQAKTLMTKSEYRAALEGPLREYLRSYGKREDSMTAEVRAWADDADRAETKRAVEERRASPLKFNDEIGTALAAMDDEDAGKLDKAKETWQSLKKFSNDPDKRGLALVADKALEQLNKAESEFNKLYPKVRNENPERPYKGTYGNEELAVEAIRAEEAKDCTALKRWEAVMKATEGGREWLYLEAAKKVSELKETPKKQNQP